MIIGLVAGLSITIDSFFMPAIECWEAEGHRVFVGTSDARSTDAPHSRITGLSRRPHPRNLAAPTQLKRWVADNSIDVVVTNTATTSFLTRIHGLGVPVVYFCHGLHWDASQRRSPVWEAAERLALRNTAGVIVLNQHDQDWFATRDVSPLLRLPYGVGLDPNRYPRTPMPPCRDGLRLAWIGEFSQRKRPLDAVRVVAELYAHNTPATLAMLGEGPLQSEALHLARSLGVSDHVDFLGFQPALPILMSSHHVLHTASWEGLTRVGLEAVSVGRHVFGYDVKGVRDLPWVTAVEPFDPSAITSAIERDLTQAPGRPPCDPDDLAASQIAQKILEFLMQIHPQA